MQNTEAKTISVGQIEDNKSPYGNEFVTIRKDQLVALCHGKVLCVDINDGEYKCFISLEKKIANKITKKDD